MRISSWQIVRLKPISSWIENHGMALNVAKTESIVFFNLDLEAKISPLNPNWRVCKVKEY